MDTLSYKTQYETNETVDRKWLVIDASNQVVGRLCTQVASYLRGKHKPSFAPHMDAGDYVIIINADKVRFTGRKWTQKQYVTFSGYPGGQKKRTAQEQLDKKPIAIIEHGVKGMLPKTKLGRKMFKKLFVYTGSDHPHTAQKPVEIKLNTNK